MAAEGALALDGVELRSTPTRSGVASFLMRPIEGASAVLLLALIALVLVGVVSRYFLSSPIIWIDEVAGIVFIWLSMLGAVIAIDRGEHLRLTLFLRFIPPRYLPLVDLAALVIVASFLLAMIGPAIEHAEFEFGILSPALEISAAYKIGAIAAGFTLMFAITAVEIIRLSRWRDVVLLLVFLALLLGAIWLSRPLLLSIGKTNIVIFLAVVPAIRLCNRCPNRLLLWGSERFRSLFFSTNIDRYPSRGTHGRGHVRLHSALGPRVRLSRLYSGRDRHGESDLDFVGSVIGHVRGARLTSCSGSLSRNSWNFGVEGVRHGDGRASLVPGDEAARNQPREMGPALLATGAVMADTVPPSITLIVLGSVAGLSIAGLFTSGFVIAFAFSSCWRSSPG